MSGIVINVVAVIALIGGLVGLAALFLARRRERSDPVESFKPISDWKPTGHIDFTALDHEVEIPQRGLGSRGSFVLRVEDYRVIESVNIGGAKRLEYRWRRATLREAKHVASLHNRTIKSADESVALAIRGPRMVPDADKARSYEVLPAMDQPEEASSMTAH
jgi:hypothetical protein